MFHKMQCCHIVKAQLYKHVQENFLSIFSRVLTQKQEQKENRTQWQYSASPSFKEKTGGEPTKRPGNLTSERLTKACVIRMSSAAALK